MIDQQRIMLIDDAGILRYEHAVSSNPFNLSSLSNSLFSGMITAINALSNELGGILQILVIGREKMASRYIEFNKQRAILIVADKYNCRDDLLLLKTEIVSRLVTPLFKLEISNKAYNPNPLANVAKALNEESKKTYFSTIIKSKSSKHLLNDLKQIPCDYNNFEGMINTLIRELPSPEILSDPSLILVDKSRIIVPHDLRKDDLGRLLNLIINTTQPLLGERFINSLFEKFNINSNKTP